MKLQQCTDQREWDHFIAHSSSSYLQSFLWGEFQAGLGAASRVYRFGVYDTRGKLRIACQVVEQVLGFGVTQWYIGDGPVLAPGVLATEVAEFLVLLSECADRRVGYLRVEPPQGAQARPAFHRVSEAFRTYRPQYSVQLRLHDVSDLSKLLLNVKSKTRYNIRLAERRGVRVIDEQSQHAPERFFRLAQETARRDRFAIHSLSYYQQLYVTYRDSGLLHWYIAQRGQQDIAAIVVLHYNDVAYYLYGASATQYREDQASSLVQWKAISSAFDEGLSWYDFYGTTPLRENQGQFLSTDSRHLYSGITRFKLGFVPGSEAGRIVSHEPSYDLIKRPLAYQLLLLRRTLLSK